MPTFTRRIATIAVVCAAIATATSGLAGANENSRIEERLRFRNFLANLVSCASAGTNDGACVKAAVLAEPESLRWIGDPDRLELLFQASRLEHEAKPLLDRLRALLKKNAAKIAETLNQSLPVPDPRLGGAQLEKLIERYGFPNVGLFAASRSPDELNEWAARVPADHFKAIEKNIAKMVAQFNIADVKGFSTLVNSTREMTQDSNERVRKLTNDLLAQYLRTLTREEKSRILADFFRSPIEGNATDKLRPLLENLDPIMQKILQLFGRKAKDPTLEHALSLLESSLTPYPVTEMKDRFEARYGRRFDEVFRDYDPAAIRRATTGQVVFATEIATGERVAIKARAPGILANYQQASTRLLGLPSVKSNPGIAEFVRSLLDGIAAELDYRNEATYSDLAKQVYTSPARKIHPVERLERYAPYEDILVYGYASGVKSTSLKEGNALRLRAERVRNLIELWTETVFFKNLETADGKFRLTTLFHGDLHPGNFMIDPATGWLVLLDFGNVGLFPLSERRDYIRLYLASLDDSSAALVKTLKDLTGEKNLSRESWEHLGRVAKEIWSDPKLKATRMTSFITRATDEVGMPVANSITSLLRGMAFLEMEATQIDALLPASSAKDRVDFPRTMKRALVARLREELPRTLFGKSEDALVDRRLLADAAKSYAQSRFVSPCLNLFRGKEGGTR
jgi:predicted unusual protein kinase regulating ubiquinone biosynthesis (AarF/ABC1/UbiB family)